MPDEPKLPTSDLADRTRRQAELEHQLLVAARVFASGGTFASPQATSSSVADKFVASTVASFLERFAFLASIRSQVVSSPLAPQVAQSSRIEPLFGFTSGGAEYLIAARKAQLKSDEPRGVEREASGASTSTNARTSTGANPVREWLWPAERLAPTDLVYDVTDEILHGKAKPILCDLSRQTLRVYATLPTQIEQVSLRSGEDRAGEDRARSRVVALAVEFQDAGGRTIQGGLPYHVEFIAADGRSFGSQYLLTAADGFGRFRVPQFADNGPARPWTVSVRSQLCGLTALWKLNPPRAAAPTLLTFDQLQWRELGDADGLSREWAPRRLVLNS